MRAGIIVVAGHVTRQKDCNAIQEVELLAHDGFDGIGEAMRLERQNHLGVGPYERSEHRRGHANGSVIGMAVLVAAGVSATGHRQILGASVSLSEQEVHWREFLRHLQQSDLHGVNCLSAMPTKV